MSFNKRERERQIYLQWNFCVDLKLTMLAYEWFQPPQFHPRWSRSLSKCNESHWKLQSTEWAHSHWQIKEKKLGCIKHSSSRTHTKRGLFRLHLLLENAVTKLIRLKNFVSSADGCEYIYSVTCSYSRSHSLIPVYKCALDAFFVARPLGYFHLSFFYTTHC